MSEINTGGFAFPRPGDYNPQMGMTLRDYFAAKAMQGALADPDLVMSKHEIAAWAYEIADAMIQARGESK